MYLDRTSNVVVYDAPPQAERILQYVPGSKRLHNGYIGCPGNLYNLQLLRYLGLAVPPPMENNYDWPGRFKPFTAQRVTSNFLALHPRAFVLSDMGTGKTLSALWAADYVMRQFPAGVCRALVIAPLSTLHRVWSDAVFSTFMGRRKAVVVYGSASKRRELLAEPADFYIINYDGVEVLKGELGSRVDIRMVVVDEASAYKDRGTKRHRLTRALLAPRDYFWMMTGTPTANGPLDAYGLAKLVNNCHGESYYGYRDRVMHRVSQFKWRPKSGAHAEAHKMLQPSVRFAIEDCVDLPPLNVQQREAELSPEQNKEYRAMKRDLQIMLANGPITAPNEAVLRMKLIQISCGAIYGKDRVVSHLDASPRIAVLREVLEQSREKVIIFAPLTSVIHMLHKELSKDYSCRIVNGEVGQKERSEIFRAFEQDTHPRVLIADPGTMSHGLTLVAATTIVWYGPTDRTEQYIQANKRIHRPGQTKTCAIVQIASTPIEREIYRRLASNESLQGLLLQMARGDG